MLLNVSVDYHVMTPVVMLSLRSLYECLVTVVIKCHLKLTVARLTTENTVLRWLSCRVRPL